MWYHLHGDSGEAVNTSDCDSDMRGFESRLSPHVVLWISDFHESIDVDAEHVSGRGFLVAIVQAIGFAAYCAPIAQWLVRFLGKEEIRVQFSMGARNVVA